MDSAKAVATGVYGEPRKGGRGERGEGREG